MKHPATLLCIVSLACSGSALALWWCDAPSVAWMVWALALVVLAVALAAWRDDEEHDTARTMLCAGGCGVSAFALCPRCRLLYFAESDPRVSAAAVSMLAEWHDDTSRELSRRGAPDITRRVVDGGA